MKPKEKYLLVLELLKSKGRLAVDDAELTAVLGTARKTGKPLIYRVATYMSYIRRFAKLEVKTVRSGKLAVAYELVVANPAATDDSRWQASKYISKTPDDSTAAVTVAT